MSSRKFKTTLQNDSRERCLSKFCEFVDQFNAHHNKPKNEEREALDESNTIHLDDTYSLSDRFVEHIDLVELVRTSGNLRLNSIIMVLFDLTNELQLLAQDALRFIRPIAFYGNRPQDDEESGLDEIAKLIDVLFDLVCYLRRCNELGVNFFMQLTNIFHQQNNNKDRIANETMMIRFKNTRLDQLFELFQNLTVRIINLEEVVRTNQKLKKDFFSFKQVIEFANLNESKFHLDENKKKEIEFLLSMIAKMETELFDCNSFFTNFYLHILKSLSSQTDLVNNQIVNNHFQSYIRYKLNEFEMSKFIQLNQWLGLCALFVVYVHLFNKEDKKLTKIILETQKRLEILLINLEGNAFVVPDKFLVHNLPRSFIDRKIVDLLNQQREQLVHQSRLGDQVKEIEKNLVNWFLKFNYLTAKKPRIEDANVIDHFHAQVKCLEGGLIQLKNGRNTARMYINLHVYLNKPISKSGLILICKLVNFTKAIQLAFLRKKSAILLIISRYYKFCSYNMLKNLNQLQVRLKSDSDLKPIKKAELLSVINLTSNCINGTFTDKRRFVTYFSISILVGAISEQDSSDLKIYFRRILFLDDLYKNLDELSNCDFLCFNYSIIETFFLYCSENNPNLSSELIYFFVAINDCFSLINKSLYYDEQRKVNLCRKFETYLLEIFRTNFLDRICLLYENELRNQIHHDLQLQDSNPFKRRLLNFMLLFNLGIIPLFNKFLSVKNYLEYYLNEVSYTLTSIALHDWKTYESMLNLSRNREQLNFIFSQLPSQRLEQGLDLLELTRNIQSFTADFNYNLNNQMFIQKPNDERYLDVLQIKHVSNSIQTHGFGILNTSVNYIYKFLKSKFNILSQFLFQEQIKSKLLKEIRNLKESEHGKYRFENARKLLRNLQKMGSMQNGRTYIDEFEQLITQIGNSLAFVRLLRSGAFHLSANSLKFIPDQEELNELSFEKMALSCNLNEKTIEGMRCVQLCNFCSQITNQSPLLSLSIQDA